jgi:ABC-2 type transport system permease protein
MIEALLRVFALTKKELLAILKDPRSRMSLLIPPILQCLIFGYAATYDLSDVPYALVDRDRSVASHDLIAGLDGSGVFHRVAELHSSAEVPAWIDDRRALLAIEIDQDFERRLQVGLPCEIQLIADGRNSNTGATALGYVGEIVGAFNERWREGHGRAAPPLRVTVRSWFNPNLESRWNMIPGLIGTLTMLQTMMVTAMSVAREREQGTFDQLLVTPFRPVEIMLGKALPSMLVGMIQATNVFLVAQLWFRIPFAGSVVSLYLGLVFFVLAAVGIGLVISSAARTMQQAMLYSFLLLMPFTLLSGLTTPVSAMPVVFQYLTLLDPLRYAIEAAQRVYLEGAPLTDLGGDLWPLALMAVVTLSAASWLFRYRLS